MSNGTSRTTAFDVKRAWKVSKKALDSMTPAQRTQTLIKSGVLTKKGNVTRVYKGVFKPARAKA